MRFEFDLLSYQLQLRGIYHCILNVNFITGNGNGGNGLSSNYNAPGAANTLNNEYSAPGSNGNGLSSEEAFAASIPGGGVPGEDYPVLSEVPETGFQCEDQAVSGYYADDADEAGCQVFHICQLRETGQVQQDSFLCPNGTIFNQQYLVCDWWFNFDCSTAQDFYSVNELIGIVPEGGAGRDSGYGSGASASSRSQNGGQNGNSGYGY